ncbi:helix-turn-helix domain-containing protein [Allofournierella sp.]|uniref:helix-turn-helix domain-containing protein n=1 Tax=Allofournierella sp. TaxID=1940256 RepID=UPI003AB7ED94
MAYVSTYLKKEVAISSIVTIHYFEYPCDFVFHGESHDFWEFLYVDRGGICVQAGGETHTLGPGEVIFHEPCEFHAFRATGERPPNLVVMSFFSDSSFMDYFRGGVFRLTPNERTIISRIIAAAKDCFSTPLNVPSIEKVELRDGQLAGYPQLISLYLEQFLLTIYHTRNRMQASAKHLHLSENEEQLSGEKILDQIVKYMEDHLTEKLTVPDLCTLFSLSRATLEGLFHKEKEMGAIAYFNMLKIDKAKELLRGEAMNITELSYYLSFSSLQYFSRQFKLATGMSPREYLCSVKGIAQSLKNSVPHYYAPPR